MSTLLRRVETGFRPRISKPRTPFCAQVDLKPASDVLAGAMARAASQSTIHPLDTLKVPSQSPSHDAQNDRWHPRSRTAFSDAAVVQSVTSVPGDMPDCRVVIKSNVLSGRLVRRAGADAA